MGSIGVPNSCHTKFLKKINEPYLLLNFRGLIHPFDRKGYCMFEDKYYFQLSMTAVTEISTRKRFMESHSMQRTIILMISKLNSFMLTNKWRSLTIWKGNMYFNCNFLKSIIKIYYYLRKTILGYIVLIFSWDQANNILFSSEATLQLLSKKTDI